MTKEEVEGNIRLLPYHRLYLKSLEETIATHRRKDISAPMKIRILNKIRKELITEWERLNV